MKRLDWFILGRVGSRMAVTVLVFYGLIVLAEALDTWRFNDVSENFGFHWAIIMVLASGARWAIKTLPVTVLLGAIIGFIDLKARHELTVIKSSGMSIWRIIRAPTVALLIVSLAISLFVETQTTSLIRQLAPMPPGEATLLTPPGEIWLEQRSGDTHYIMVAQGMEANGSRLRDVVVFPVSGQASERIEGPLAELGGGQWRLPEARIHRTNMPAETVTDLALPTTSTAAEVSLKLTSIEDVTFFELATLIGAGIADPAVQAAALTRFIKLLSMPLLLTGSLFIAFAFTAGYRRSDNYGLAVLYGIVLGFVVFVITEMSERAGSGGVLEPAFAALGPAFVAIVIGVTVLLYKEDGRA
jgi:lipopolysaccharide export system permease protein